MLAETLSILGKLFVVVDVCVASHKYSSERQRSFGSCLAALLSEMKLMLDLQQKARSVKHMREDLFLSVAAARLFSIFFLSRCCVLLFFTLFCFFPLNVQVPVRGAEGIALVTKPPVFIYRAAQYSLRH